MMLSVFFLFFWAFPSRRDEDLSLCGFSMKSTEVRSRQVPESKGEWSPWKSDGKESKGHNSMHWMCCELLGHGEEGEREMEKVGLCKCGCGFSMDKNRVWKSACSLCVWDRARLSLCLSLRWTRVCRLKGGNFIFFSCNFFDFWMFGLFFLFCVSVTRVSVGPKRAFWTALRKRKKKFAVWVHLQHFSKT